MQPPILRCLVPGAAPAVGPLNEPGQIAPVPAILAIETLTAYLREVDSRNEGNRAWRDFIADQQIREAELLNLFERALELGRRLANAPTQPVRSLQSEWAPRHSEAAAPLWQLRLPIDS